MPITGEGSRELNRVCPRNAFIIGVDDHRVKFAAVLAQQNRDTFAIRGTEHARLTEVCLWMRCDYRRVRPGLTTIRAPNRIDRELCKLLTVLIKAAIIMEERQVIAVFEPNSTAHRDDSTVISNRTELGERTAIILRNR